MKFVVKLGGASLENPALVHGCARAIAVLAQDGNQVAAAFCGGGALYNQQGDGNNEISESKAGHGCHLTHSDQNAPIPGDEYDSQQNDAYPTQIQVNLNIAVVSLVDPLIE